nr:hypothetical protein Iba_chr15aCG0240 [Ipomoea batatas]GMD96092.1 hypothetical protein Iba_chr15bCG1440 [Ipomoea batatas]GMD97292.1 hypothetical protein Iba_chr15cCG1220 [Ipomoea batatas]GME05874.1 hypothetical protein Iba_scaffold3550CG0030 [Ipomoea batatas]
MIKYRYERTEDDEAFGMSIIPEGRENGSRGDIECLSRWGDARTVLIVRQRSRNDLSYVDVDVVPLSLGVELPHGVGRGT